MVSSEGAICFRRITMYTVFTTATAAGADRCLAVGANSIPQEPDINATANTQWHLKSPMSVRLPDDTC